MPVPKRKRSRARRDKRFANKGIKARLFGGCSNCGEIVMSHSVCKSCGYYKGRKVLTTKGERIIKRDEVRKEKEATMSAKEAKQIQAEPVVEPVEKK